MDDQPSERDAVDVRVTGRVQGVSFRVECAHEARRLGVAGWVSNESDGSVRGHFEGPAESVEELVRWCRSGPPLARVADVTIPEAASEGVRAFEAR